ncbi:hypothetical protein [Streptomyces sp. NBC_01465]|uniref:hypothetical protein n=1 Tax=Streptomyces sp. NBC_01465 TaxID=2903878 RepID=UPI002E2EE0B3|nr:hypothetical protein [Streptomyces sp. NBC_01465]
MHQKKITATLLAGLAVSAASGCMAVSASPVPTPSAQSAPSRPAPYVEPQIVQAPAIEALEAAGPAETADPARTARTNPSTPAAPEARRPERSAAPRSRPVVQRHKTPAPRVDPAAPAASSDICALGQGYGGWQPDSPEARICRQTYGN